ncbi:MAG: ATP-grasp domain-containing protein [Pseudomonadota bacterium]
MSSQEVKIAVGSAGSSTGFGAMRALSEAVARGHMRARLLACDTNPEELVPAATEFEFCRVPSAQDPNFVSQAIAVMASRGVTAYYPIHDAEIESAARARDDFASHGIAIFAPDIACIEGVRDKLRMADILSAFHVPNPETKPLIDAVWQGAALHVKPRTGVGSVGAFHVEDADSLARHKARADAAGSIVQPFIPGVEITLDVYCPEAGQVAACSCRERLQVKAGVCTKARLFKDPGLERLSAQVSAALGLAGSFCFQVRGNPSDGPDGADYQVIDVNPRVGGATPMSLAVGLNFAAAHAMMHLGFDAAPVFKRQASGDLFVTRSFREHVAQAR